MSYRVAHPMFIRTFDHYENVPREFRECFWNYLAYGLSPGGCSTGIITNDFGRAVCSAHVSVSMDAMRDMAKWWINVPPQESYGSMENLEKWMALSQEEKTQRLIEKNLRPHEFDILSGREVR